MLLLVLFLGLILPSSSYLESINTSELSSAESCFDAKILSPTHICTTQTLLVLNSLKTSLLQIESVQKTVPRKLIPGLETGILNVFASHSQSLLFRAENARLSAPNSWCSGTLTSADLFFQIGSSIPVEYHLLEVKGNYAFNVDSFTIKYTLDGVNWTQYNAGETFYKTFDLSRFSFVPFIARAIRINIINRNGNICSKFEVLVKPLTNHKVLSSGSLISAIKSGFKLKTSSFLDENYHGQFANFEFYTDNNEWCAGFQNKNQWISISSDVIVKWNKLTMGADGGVSFTKSFKIRYSNDGVTWNWYENGFVFTGISSGSQVNNYTLISFDALVIRVYPETWQWNPCMRLEAFCSEI